MNGRMAAVLGVGPGLGAAIARRFAGEGFAVAMMARREESLAEIRRDIEGSGGTALPLSADATDPDSVAAGFERARSDLGDPEVLVYNAGAFQRGGVLEVSPARFDECYRANCAGAMCANSRLRRSWKMASLPTSKATQLPNWSKRKRPGRKTPASSFSLFTGVRGR
jgi:NAD(P)-dependent dehydrogenase (short-subunit alcohol dehydrogenase family)